ncbi:MAG TPA: DinB family protein, partial [Gemmatimonadales bacterium]|nr:DinB family protein [Gemmatimonadales bacterium]
AEFSTTADLMERFDRHVAEGRGSLAKASDADMGAIWTLKNAGAVIFALPKAVVYRSFVMSHLIHHRGQLSVYLRLRDVPLPSLYGPTADTR